MSVVQRFSPNYACAIVQDRKLFFLCKLNDYVLGFITSLSSAAVLDVVVDCDGKEVEQGPYRSKNKKDHVVVCESSAIVNPPRLLT